MNFGPRMFLPAGRRALSTALRPRGFTPHILPPQKTFVRGAAVVPGIFPIHKLPLLTFLRHQSVAPKTAEIEDTLPQIKPRYKIIYTCGVCQKRSEETFSKQAYHHGTVIIRCEGCSNLHLIADHLKIVSETRVELEDVLEGKTTIRTGIFLEDRGSVIEFGEPQTDTEPEENLLLPDSFPTKKEK